MLYISNRFSEVLHQSTHLTVPTLKKSSGVLLMSRFGLSGVNLKVKIKRCPFHHVTEVSPVWAPAFSPARPPVVSPVLGAPASSSSPLALPAQPEHTTSTSAATFHPKSLFSTVNRCALLYFSLSFLGLFLLQFLLLLGSYFGGGLKTLCLCVLFILGLIWNTPFTLSLEHFLRYITLCDWLYVVSLPCSGCSLWGRLWAITEARFLRRRGIPVPRSSAAAAARWGPAAAWTTCLRCSSSAGRVNTTGSYSSVKVSGNNWLSNLNPLFFAQYLIIFKVSFYINKVLIFYSQTHFYKIRHHLTTENDW